MDLDYEKLAEALGNDPSNPISWKQFRAATVHTYTRATLNRAIEYFAVAAR